MRDGDIYDHITFTMSSARRLFAKPSSKHRQEQWADQQWLTIILEADLSEGDTKPVAGLSARSQRPNKRPHNMIGLNAANRIGSHSRHLWIESASTFAVDGKIPRRERLRKGKL